MVVKSHVCDWPNCGKAFTRAEHLRRHALNHEEPRSGYTCERCSVHFNRPDLLTRHMMRHAKRDEEAGGPGLGILETRKRTRRAANGTIVTKPAKRQARKAISNRHARSVSHTSFESASEENAGLIESHDFPHGAPVSPPSSAHLESRDQRSNIGISDEDALLAPMMPAGPYEPYVEPIAGQFDAADGSWGTSPFGDMFTADTAMDFNMPFAVTHNYNWLFDVSCLDDAFVDLDWPLEPISPNRDSIPSLPGEERDATREMNSGEFVELCNSDMDFNMDPSSMLLEAATFVDKGLYPDAGTSSNIHQQPGQTASEYLEMEWMTGQPQLDTSSRPRLPHLSEETRSSILGLISHAKDVNGASPLLSLEALQGYCDLFFSRFNVAYPLIHPETFNPNRAEPVFLAAVLCLGATYSSREAHQIAVGIHDSLQNQLFCHPDFSPQPDLWVLQAMLLIDCFGKMRAGPKQRDRAQLFHCVLIKMIRRSNCCVIQAPTIRSRPKDLEHAWIEAMDLEQRKRLAMHCFMWDTQHAVLFSQSLCMSAFEMRFPLPCDASTWEASTPEQWFQCAMKESNHPFLSALKGYIAPHAVHRPRHLNALARIFLLHGLMSLSSDLRRRDQTTIRSETPELAGAWKHRIGRSYDLWKIDFDADCMAMKLGQAANPRRFTGIKMAAHALYRSAHITLSGEILDLQICAGTPHILGRAVTQSDVERSRRNIPQWLQEESGVALKAAKHASLILQDAVMSLDDWDDADAFHFPWCLYLATLTCWAFHMPEEGHNVPNPCPQSDEDAKTEMSSLIVAMTTCSSLDELASVGVHDAMKVLLRLVGL
ncbi:C2H2 finger domain transcription factor [Aspergillus chevalieri]|uniref:C2H2-type domain-containing protein n=1 Tax=Aspergillus chevalieri TaxID=182096 RepID=A0A7R7VLD4_ASPCH|nr:uncharacterized protein ACHE_30020A [Aspergillus chevalieri]BCR86033.1 hypothetical protein ACHE_30020A [Aspergillus chevalieri]